MVGLLLLLPLSIKAGSKWGCSVAQVQASAGNTESMGRLKIERIGGLAGFGLPGSRLKSEGEVAISDLSPADRKAVDALFESKGKTSKGKPSPPMPDAFRYRITRQTPKGTETIEVTEDRVPMVLKNSVRDQLK